MDLARGHQSGDSHGTRLSSLRAKPKIMRSVWRYFFLLLPKFYITYSTTPSLTYWSYYTLALNHRINSNQSVVVFLTHSCCVTHICVSKLSIIGSDNGLSPAWHQAIIWPNTGILSIRILGPKFQWNLKQNLCVVIQENAFKNVVCEVTAIVSRPQCV